MNRRVVFPAFVLLLAVTACRIPAKPVETSLYFGLSGPSGGSIPDSTWRRFEGEHVLRVFPDGYTVIDARGAWKGAGGWTSEPTRIVVSLNRMTDALSGRIDSLRERYRAAFSQESVMRVDKHVDRWDY